MSQPLSPKEGRVPLEAMWPLQHIIALACFLPGANTATSSGYIARPSFKKRFPDRALFHQSGRKLAAEGEKPERIQFEIEDGGYQFSYEFGGTPTIERVFSLDSEGVEGIQCSQGPHDGHLKIYWRDVTAASIAKLQKDVATWFACCIFHQPLNKRFLWKL